MYTSARRVNFVALGPCTFIKQTPLRLTKYLISSSKRTRILLVQLSWSLRICSGLYLQLLSYFTTVKISFTSIVQLKLINKLILKKTLLSFGLPKTLELVDQFFISFHWVGAVNVYQQEDKPIRASIQQLGVFTFNTTSSNLQVVSSPLQRFRIWTGFIHTRVAAADIAS